MQRKEEFYRQFIGKRQGEMTIIRILRTEPRRGKIWECKCDCGSLFEATTSQISHHKLSQCPDCGRLKCKESSVEQLSTHGRSKEKLHQIWLSMKSRCKYPGDTNYKHYGARGIKVCQEWADDYTAFRTWSLLNGYEEGLSIDRINVNGDYTPENCRWIPMSEQFWNKRNTVLITVLGRTQCQNAWAEELGISHSTLSQVRKRGENVEKYIEKRLAAAEVYMEG